MSNASYEIQEIISGQSFSCLPGQSVLRAMEAQGMHCLPVGCRGGGCGLCKVQVLSGDYRRGRMSCKHISSETVVQGLALACQVFPLSDLTIVSLRQLYEDKPDNKNH
ncbi:MAG: ferredoxin [Pseudomonas sp. CO183]|jgi:ferredoxin|nr:MAG: ferredoxin [Pseudomonas sp. BRH_c35]OCX91323.1 MAG: ferredoxin [Pseudomonas sp. CO183]